MPFDVMCSVRPLLGGYFYDELVKDIYATSVSIYAMQYQWRWNTHERRGKVQMLGTAIQQAKRRGCKICVVMNDTSPGSNITKINQVTANALNKLGVDAVLKKTEGLIHSKLWVLDSNITYIGSHNISSRSLSTNEESSVRIESKEIAKFMTEYILKVKG